MPRLRLIWLLIILVSLALYFPINRLAHGGMELSLPIDSLIPLFPPAVVPYLFGTILFVTFPVWAAFRTTTVEFKAFTTSWLLATGISYAVYIAFPTFVNRPESVSTDFFSKVISLLYQTDKAYNAAPSGHAAYTILILLFLSNRHPRWRLLWLTGGLTILASTLLTRQHNVMDVISGIGLGVFAYIIGAIAARKI